MLIAVLVVIAIIIISTPKYTTTFGLTSCWERRRRRRSSTININIHQQHNQHQKILAVDNPRRRRSGRRHSSTTTIIIMSSSSNNNNIFDMNNNNDKAAEEESSSSSQHQHQHHQDEEKQKQKHKSLWMIKNGRIVVRMLPSEIVDRDYEQKQKPGSPVKILPSSVVVAKNTTSTSRGPLEWNPPYPRVARKQQQQQHQQQQQFQEEEIQKIEEKEKEQVKVNVDLSKKEPPKIYVKLDVYLFPQEQKQEESCLSSSQTATTTTTTTSTSTTDHHDHHTNDDVISMTLHRNIDEDAIATIKRLGINISKQLKKRIGNKKRKKNNNNNKLPSSSKGSTTDSTTISFLEATIQQQQQQQDQNISSSNNNNTQQQTAAVQQEQQLKIENMTSGELWTIALTKPLTLTFGLQGDDGDDKSTTIIKIPFYVECNPPTIISVSTYEKFYAKNFPGIPLVIDVKTLWSTNTIVDWYTTTSDDDSSDNNNSCLLVCHNSRCYIPTINDANKSLKVLITPIRRRQGQVGGDDHGDYDDHHHNGEGCQEAYQFQQQIESYLPTNAVLQIRTPTWISPITSNPNTTSSSSLSSSPFNNNNNTIRVLTYNILADQNTELDNDDDGGLQSHIIDRKYRMPLILYEILSYKADIICLQEVDELIYETLFKPVLVGYYNYQGYCSIKQTKGTKEGSAMFWSLDVFQQQQEEEEECNNNKSFLLRNILQDLVYGNNNNSVIKEEWDDVATTIRNEIFDKRPDVQHTVCKTLGHVLQIAHLKHRRSGKPILIANAHNFFHPIADHVRTLQLIAAAYQLSVESSSSSSSSSNNDNHNNDIPFIFCGDFNTSLKNAARILVERYTPKNFHRHKRHFNTFSWEECDIPQPQGFDHDFPEIKLPDSFPIILPAYTIQPDFTHYVVGYKGSLDHIMFTSKSKKMSSSCCSSSSSGGEKADSSNNDDDEIVMKVLRCGDMPTEEQVTRYGPAMPNPSYPSDHISLICDIEITC